MFSWCFQLSGSKCMCDLYLPNWGHFVEVWLHQTSFSIDKWWCYACYTSVVQIYLWYHRCLRPPQAFHLGTASNFGKISCICMCFFMFCSEKTFLEYRSQIWSQPWDDSMSCRDYNFHPFETVDEIILVGYMGLKDEWRDDEGQLGFIVD